MKSKSILFRFAVYFLIALFLGCAFQRKIPLGEGDAEWGVEVTWLGHSCFTLEDSLGRRVAIDPFDETVGFGYLNLRADALFVTHRHFDHNSKGLVKARRVHIDLVQSTGTQTVAGDLLVTGVASYHDNVKGEIHGDNIIYVFKMGGLKIAHMGDIGQEELTPYQVSILGSVDILFIPVGGFTTIGPSKAYQWVKKLNPRIVFPMHFGNLRIVKLASVEEFLKKFDATDIRNLDTPSVRIRAKDMGLKTEVITLTPVKRN